MARKFSRRRKRRYSAVLKAKRWIPPYGKIIVGMRKPGYWVTGDLQRCEFDDVCYFCKKVVPGKTLASIEDYGDTYEVNYYLCERCVRKNHYQSELGQLGRYLLYSNFNMWKRQKKKER